MYQRYENHVDVIKDTTNCCVQIVRAREVQREWRHQWWWFFGIIGPLRIINSQMIYRELFLLHEKLYQRICYVQFRQNITTVLTTLKYANETWIKSSNSIFFLSFFLINTFRAVPKQQNNIKQWNTKKKHKNSNFLYIFIFVFVVYFSNQVVYRYFGDI